MVRHFFTLVASLAVTSAHADLLIELEHRMVGPDMGQVQPIDMNFRSGIEFLSDGSAALGGGLMPADEGRVFAATASQLAAFESALNHPQGVWESNVIWTGIIGGAANNL